MASSVFFQKQPAPATSAAPKTIVDWSFIQVRRLPRVASQPMKDPREGLANQSGYQCIAPKRSRAQTLKSARWLPAEGQDQGVKQTFSSVEDKTAPCQRRGTDENLAQRDFADTQLFGIES
jgi:hypothetical protein